MSIIVDSIAIHNLDQTFKPYYDFKNQYKELYDSYKNEYKENRCCHYCDVPIYRRCFAEGEITVSFQNGVLTNMRLFLMNTQVYLPKVV